jgi:hypothetical protein
MSTTTTFSGPNTFNTSDIRAGLDLLRERRLILKRYAGSLKHQIATTPKSDRRYWDLSKELCIVKRDIRLDESKKAILGSIPIGNSTM